MKNKLLLFCVCILYALQSFSQTSVVGKSQNYSTNRKVLIKEYNYPATIACANSGADSVTFIYTDGTMQSAEIVIRGYWINDIAIVKDTLFFCGRTAGNSPTSGIFGFFKFNSSFTPVSGIHICDNILAGETSNKVIELTRMKPFFTSYGERHVACLGFCDYFLNHCFIDFYSMNAPTTMWNYFGGIPNNENETFSDVTLVSTYLTSQKYIVTSGFDTRYGKYINLRVYNPDYTLDPTGIENRMFTYSVDPVCANEWSTDRVLLSPVGDGIFSTASVRDGHYNNCENPGLCDYSLHIAFYNIAALLSNSVFAMTQDIYVNLSSTIKKDLERYIVKPSTKTLALLHNYGECSIGQRSVFCEVDYPSLTSAGSLRAFQYPDNNLQGMSTYKNQTKYVMSGFSRSDNNWLKYEMETFGSNSLCAEKVDYKYYAGQTLSSINEESGFSTIMGKVTWENISYERRYLGVHKECDNGSREE